MVGEERRTGVTDNGSRCVGVFIVRVGLMRGRSTSSNVAAEVKGGLEGSEEEAEEGGEVVEEEGEEAEVVEDVEGAEGKGGEEDEVEESVV